MKLNKLFLTLVIMVTVLAPSWAQIDFSSWGRLVITPIAFSKEYSAVSAATSTWGDVPRIGFSANGTSPSKNIGFNLDFDFGIDITNENKIAIVGDNAKAWIYPLGLLIPEHSSILKFVGGWFVEDELRGKIGATEFGSWVLPNGSKDEDNIFTRLKASAGAYMRLEPLEWWDSPWNGLTLHAVIGSNAIGANGNRLRAPLNLYNNEANATEGSTVYNEGWGSYDGNRNTSAKDVYRAGQYAVGYRLPDIGLFRAQFIGNNRNVRRLDSIAQTGNLTDIEKTLITGIDRGDAQMNADVLEFAFLYDGYKDLRVDVGFKMPLEYDYDNTMTAIEDIFVGSTQKGEQNRIKGDTYTVQLAKVIALGVNWKPAFLSDLNIMTRIDYSFGRTIERSDGRTKVETGSSFGFWLVPSYQIIDNLTVGLDFGMEIKEEDSITKDSEPHPVDYPPEWTGITGHKDFGFAPWMEISVGGGKVRTGVVIMLPGSPRFKSDVNNKVTPKFLGDPVISVPISITYSF